MLGWWSELPWWLRLLLGVIVLMAGVGVAAASAAGRLPVSRRRAVMVGAALVGVGLGLILVGGKSSAERKGYHF